MGYNATMEREVFHSLDDERLGYVCMEPVFSVIRAKPPELKARVISQLGGSQRALCMFRVLYDHSAPSAMEFYAWLCYLQEQPGYWEGVLSGLDFFGDIGMRQFLEDTQAVLATRNERLGRVWSEAGAHELDKDEELAQNSLSLIAAYIRSHPQEFVEFTD